MNKDGTFDKNEQKLLPLVRAYMLAEQARNAADKAHQEYMGGAQFQDLTRGQQDELFRLGDIAWQARLALSQAGEAYEKKAKRLGLWSYGKIGERKRDELIRRLKEAPSEVVEALETPKPVEPPEGVDIVTLYRCEDCGVVSEDYKESPLYECSNCGTVFNRDNSSDGGSHRCPDCNKFASKLAEISCDSCERGPVEEVEGVICPEDNEAVPLEDWAEHVEEHAS